MVRALKAVVVPLLREHGFTGSFPHFRRLHQLRIDLLTFQFDRHGGGFIIEIGRCGPQGFTTHWGKQIPPEKVRAWDLPAKQRARIQPRNGSGTDSWFRFDDLAADDFTRTANSVVPFLTKAETMFDEFEHVLKLGEATTY